MYFCQVLFFILNILKVISDGDVSSSSSVSESTFTSFITRSPLSCTCDNVVNSTLVENAKKMKNQVQNKTMISKIRHRATHSHDAVWASVCLSSLLVLVIVGLLQSRMWSDQTFLSYPESQPVKYEQHNEEAEVKVKHILRSQARKLKKYFSKKARRKDSAELQSFKMETFLQGSDLVDSRYKQLMESSDDTQDSEEDEVFSINRRTGDWESLRSGRQERPSGDRRGRYQIISTSVTSVTRDLSRVSESSGEGERVTDAESEPLISI